MAHEHEGNMINEFDCKFPNEINLSQLKCLRMSEAADQFHFLNTLAEKHNELVAFLQYYLAK